MSVNPAKLPDMPPAANQHPEVLRVREQRAQILRLLVVRGEAMRRQEIAEAVGIDEVYVGERMTELKKLGLVRVERRSRMAFWEAVEADEDEA